jgi:hypothetical protein
MALLPWPLLAVTTLLIVCSLPVSAQVSNVYTLCDPNWSGVVDLGAYSPSVYIQTPNFGVGNYGNNLLCSAVIRSGAEPLVLSFSYSAFALENYNCQFDSLCVNGVTFCGDWLTRRTVHNILPPFQTLTLSLKTDGIIGLSGFQVEVTPEYANNQVVQEVTGGVSYNESGTQYTSVNYYDGYAYYDKCASLATTYPPYYYETTSTSTPELETTPQNGNVYYFPESPYEPATVVDINAASVPFRIRRRNSTRDAYYNYQKSDLVIRSGPEDLILYLVFSNFHLQECYAGCACGSLCVNGVNLCWQGFQGSFFQYKLPAYSSFTLRFTAVDTESEFEIDVSQQQWTGQDLYEAYSATGDFNENLSYRSVNYLLYEPYQDRCAVGLDQPSTTYFPFTETTRSSCLSNVNEIDAEIVQAIQQLYQARDELRQYSYN